VRHGRHKPDSNKACAAGTCQHTCADTERCSHAWTLRYWADGKQREPGEYRDVPVPTWLWDIARDLPDGPLMPGNGERRFQLYGTVYERFMNAARAAGVPEGFTPHSLRHAFASVMLSKGVPITDVAHWLGHRDVRVTFRIYGHLVPSAAARAIAVLDEEYTEWSRSSMH
jgi:integrase